MAANNTRSQSQTGKPRWPSLPDLVGEIKNGERSVVSLVQECLTRAAEVEDYNAILELSQEAMVRAEYLDRLIAEGKTEGALFGVPFLVKDNFLTRATRTTAASRILETFESPYQATAVDKLEDAGAIMLGKTNLDEFAHGSSTENSAFGPTKNPHDAARVPGGSSGGSAAAVALGIVPFALGTDTGGSIRLPASFCGTVGYKPSYGLVSRYGVIAMASSMDVIGPLTGSVADSGYVLDVIAGDDPCDATTISREDGYRVDASADISELKIGIVKEHMGENISDAMRTHAQHKIDVLKQAGATVEEVDLPNDAVSLEVYYIIMPSEVSSNLARYDGIKYGHRSETARNLYDTYLQSRGEGFGAEPTRRIITGTYALSSGYQDAYYKKAQKVRTLLRRDYANVFRDYDVLIGPMAPTTAFKLGEKREPVQMYKSDDLAISANLAGIPAISIPGGEIEGLPFGLQLQAPSGHDKRLLEIAAAVKEAV